VKALMRWYRSNRKLIGSLGLFALALQMTLAFGHVHLRDFVGIARLAAAQTQVAPSNADGNNNPSQPTDDYCPVCAATNLAGTLVLPGIVALPAPVASIDNTYSGVCGAPCGRIAHALFRARAPPFA
jgi:hypothetical protein